MKHLKTTLVEEDEHLSETYIPPNRIEHHHNPTEPTHYFQTYPKLPEIDHNHEINHHIPPTQNFDKVHSNEEYHSSYASLDSDTDTISKHTPASYLSSLQWKHEADDGVPLGVPPANLPRKKLTVHKEYEEPRHVHSEYDDSGYERSETFNNNSVLWNNVPGVPGDDYPVMTRVPVTDFTCNGKVHGLYADYQAQCQVWHNCHENGHDSFLCVAGTLFNPLSRTCDWWYNVDCTYITYPPYQ